MDRILPHSDEDRILWIFFRPLDLFLFEFYKAEERLHNQAIQMSYVALQTDYLSYHQIFFWWPHTCRLQTEFVLHIPIIIFKKALFNGLLKT